MKQFRLVSLIAASILLGACTAVSVNPIANSSALGVVCIIENPKVAVRDFVSVVERRFNFHGIQTKISLNRENCDTTLEYTAERSWDLRPFLDYALLTLRREGVMLGSAEYRNKGGLTVTKYAGTESKMNPVIDELLGKAGPQ